MFQKEHDAQNICWDITRKANEKSVPFYFSGDTNTSEKKKQKNYFVFTEIETKRVFCI